MIKKTVLVLNASTSLQTTLTAETHLRVAEGQFLLEEQTLNIEKSLIYRAGTRRPTVSDVHIIIMIIIIIIIIIIIKFFIIYVLSQQPQGQLQTQHSIDKVVTLRTNTT
jgi:hypothetical protein